MELLLAFLFFLLAALGLALGMLFGRAPPQGSCGGLNCVSGGACVACPRKHHEDGAG